MKWLRWLFSWISDSCPRCYRWRRGRSHFCHACGWLHSTTFEVRDTLEQLAELEQMKEDSVVEALKINGKSVYCRKADLHLVVETFATAQVWELK